MKNKMGVKERRIREKRQRREEIIDAAENVLFSKGLHYATMEDIAKEAELGKATLYVYYKSKDEILLEIRGRAIQILAKEFKKAVLSEELGLHKIEAIGRAYFKFAADYPNYYKFISLFEAVDTKIDIEESMEEMTKVSQIMCEAIEVGREDGSIRSELNPMVLGKCLWAMSTGIMQMIDLKGEAFEKHLDLRAEQFIACFFMVVNSGMKKE
jgi:AcrR family transcriptional regulator